jgi:hypothetical protein
VARRYRKYFKYILEEKFVQGTCNAIVNKDSMDLIFSKSIADIMQIERNNNLNYKSLNYKIDEKNSLVISKLPDNREDTYNL